MSTVITSWHFRNFIYLLDENLKCLLHSIDFIKDSWWDTDNNFTLLYISLHIRLYNTGNLSSALANSTHGHSFLPSLLHLAAYNVTLQLYYQQPIDWDAVVSQISKQNHVSHGSTHFKRRNLMKFRFKFLISRSSTYLLQIIFV